VTKLEHPAAVALGFQAGEEPSDGDDDPDDIPADESGVVDLGEELVQQLSLALDPYPRAPGAEIPPEHAGGAHGPFAALARLKGSS